MAHQELSALQAQLQLAEAAYPLGLQSDPSLAGAPAYQVQGYTIIEATDIAGVIYCDPARPAIQFIQSYTELARGFDPPPGDFSQQLDAVADLVTAGDSYVHHKNPQQPYRVIGHAILGMDPAILYVPEYEHPVISFARPLVEWFTPINGTTRFYKA